MVLKGDQEAAAALSVSGRYCETEPLLGSTSALMWAPLGQEELRSQAGGFRWRALRCSLLTVFWLACLAMLGTATTIIVQTPRPALPRLHWWQKDLFYQLEPSLFLDTNQDGIGDINGIRAGLPYLLSLRVGALILGPLFSSLGGSGSPPNLTQINQTLGSIEDFEELIAHSNSLGIRILLDLCSVEPWHPETLNISSNHTLPDPNTSHLGTVKSALQFWLELGVAGFRICDAEAGSSTQALEEWQATIKVYSSKEGENERILIVSSEWEDGVIVKRSLADLFTRPLLPPSRGNLSAQEVADAVEQALCTPPEAWPSWTLGGPKVGHLVSLVGELQRLFSVLTFTLPGAPFLYYGDEIGLHEQQNNSVTELPSMRWGSYQISGTVRHPTGSPGGAEAQISVEAELKEKHSILKLFKSLSQARALEVALQCGNFTLLPSITTTPSPFLAFLRSWECIHFLVLLNFGQQEAVLTDHLTPGLPTRGTIVVSSRLDRQGAVALDTLRLQPREALVVKFIDTGYNRS
ncbi:neutral and basic amino acid transport protein rBAT [Polyodon spathula]|uniref:neutral and basic amino acid transport protein rBAT n=1 Tax=Polyodon spathula TaxID=7913 RepID=UPI001B7F66E6|nr:neutral and basic amino acid transport protein rBAT [Polyodon spathula]